MLIFSECGRLGNQLFQYCGLKAIDENGALYLYGMNSLKEIFTGLEIVRPNRFVEYVMRKIIKKRLIRLSRDRGLIGFLEEREADGLPTISYEPGAIRSITYCEGAFFQDPSVLNYKAADGLQIQPSLTESAKQLLTKLGVSERAIFVHVRRGDYATFPSPPGSSHAL